MPEDVSYCKSCGAMIYWEITKKGKRMPMDMNGISHFATCPAAKKFRKPKEKGGK